VEAREEIKIFDMGYLYHTTRTTSIRDEQTNRTNQASDKTSEVPSLFSKESKSGTVVDVEKKTLPPGKLNPACPVHHRCRLDLGANPIPVLVGWT